MSRDRCTGFHLVGAGIDLVDYLGTLKLHDILNGATVTAGARQSKHHISAHVIDDGATITSAAELPA